MRTWDDLVAHKPDGIEITLDGTKLLGFDLRMELIEKEMAFGKHSYWVGRVSCESWYGSIYPSAPGEPEAIYLLTKFVHEGDEAFEGTIQKCEIDFEKEVTT